MPLVCLWYFITACIEIGCFYIAGNAVVDTQSMIKAREEARKFFSLSEHVCYYLVFCINFY